MKSTLLAFAVLAILAGVVVVFASGAENRRQQVMNPPTPTLGPRDRYVRYEVHGQGQAKNTVTNHDGAVEQYYDHLPYSLQVTATSGQAISVAARDDGYGEITCQIYLGGQKADEKTATGRFSTATCAATVP